MGDNIWLFDRNGVRTPMQWNDQPGAGFSEADPDDFWAPLIDDDTFGYQQVNVAAQTTDPGSLFHTMKHFVATRKANPVLGWGDCEFLRVANKAVLAYLRRSEEAVVLALHNLSETSQTVEFDLSKFACTIPVELLGCRSRLWPEITASPYEILLEPYEYLWLQLK